MKEWLVSARLATTTLFTVVCFLLLLCFGVSGRAETVPENIAPPLEASTSQSISESPLAEKIPGDSSLSLDSPISQSMSASASTETGPENSDPPLETSISQAIPDLGAALPTIPGADIFSGALRESIPILVPPGRNGMEPKLSLTYSSTNANSWLGMGWELAMGAIERDTRFGLDYAGDSYVIRRQGGAMQLVAVSGGYRAKIEQEFARIRKLNSGGWEVTDKSGVLYLYGRTSASRQEYVPDPNNPASVQIFKWCLDRIEDPNGNYLTVFYNKHQGQIYLDQIDYTGKVEGSVPTNSVKFYREDRTDLPVSYATSFAVTTAKRLKTIDVLNGGSLVQDRLVGGNRVRTYALTYDTDPNTSGAQYSTNNRSVLTSLQQFGKDAILDLAGTITNATAASRLPAVELGYSISANKFNIPFNMAASELSAYWTGYLQAANQSFQFTGDFNGDGRMDYMYLAPEGWKVLLNNGNGFDPPKTWVSINNPDGGVTYFSGYLGKTSQTFHFTGDFNGDGKTDFMYWQTGKGWTVLLSKSNEDGFEPPKVWADITLKNPDGSSKYGSPYWTGQAQASSQSFHFTGDFNGDGKTDFMYVAPDGWRVLFSNGDGFDAPEVWARKAKNPLYWDRYLTYSSQSFHFTGDFNGDGKTDFMYWDDGVGWTVLLSNGRTAAAAKVWANYNTAGYEVIGWSGWAQHSNQSFHFTGDFNGDGKTDFMFLASDGWRVILSNGNGFEKPTFWASINNSNGVTYWSGYLGTSSQPFHFTGDFNGDGKTDFMYAQSSKGWAVLLSNGKTFDGPKLWAPLTESDFTNTWWTGYTQKTRQPFHFVGDFNGDGKTDFMYASSAGWKVLSSNNNAPDLLTAMSNGLGSKTDITYTPSTAYDNLQLPFALQTVKNVTVCDSYDETAKTCLGTAATTSYAYADGYLNIAERDFRGFRYAKTTGPVGTNAVQSVTETWYHQGDETDPVADAATHADLKALASAQAGATKGKPYRTKVSDSQGTLYRETFSTYETISLNPNYFTPLKQVNSYRYDGGPEARQTRTSFTYDSYGNTLREVRENDVSDTTDDITVDRSYAHNDDKWIVGLPASENIYAGIGTTGERIAGKSYYYDDLTDCNGTLTTLQAKGNLTRVKSWLDGVNDPETRLAYDDYGNRICSRDANLNVTTVTYDASATFPVLTVNPLGHQTVTSYYSGGIGDNGLYGQVKSVTDPNNVTTTLEYDALGRKTTEVLPDNSTKTTAYNYFGTAGSQNVKTTSSLGPRSEQYFDGLGRTVKTRKYGDPGTKIVVSETFYDGRGAVDRTSLPYFQGQEETRQYTTYAYDAMGRAIRATAPDQAQTLTCYDRGVTVTIDPNNHRKRKTMDLLGRLVKVEEYTGTTAICTTESAPTNGPTLYAKTIYEYDLLGRLSSVTDSNNNKTEMLYDKLGRKTFMSDPDMGDWSYEYDANGNLKKQIDAKNQPIIFSYDALNRVTSKHYPVGTDVTYTYDEPTATYPLGRLTTMLDESGSTKYFYDKFGRANKTETTIDGSTYTVKSDYDGLGRVVNVTYPGEVVGYTYNSDGSLASVGNYLTFSNYNAFGQPESLAYGNGVSTTYQYQPNDGRLFSIITNNPTQGLLNISYAYDTKGNVSGVTDHLDGSRNRTFTYDELDRLTKAQVSYGTLSYGYDAIGNLVTKEGVTYTYGTKPHAVASLSTGKAYGYDANGNVISDGPRTIDYTFDNMPRSINNYVSFSYNGAGSRVKKTSPSGTTVYIGKLYECTNGLCDKHIYAGNSRIALKTATQTFYHHTDHLGSATVVTDNSGAVVETLAYYPFGGTQTDNASFYQNYKYTGQELDSETGLYNYNARLYDPELGRFVTADSIVPDPANPQSLNRYSYVVNNPLSRIDPTGHYDDGYESYDYGGWGSYSGDSGSISFYNYGGGYSSDSYWSGGGSSYGSSGSFSYSYTSDNFSFRFEGYNNAGNSWSNYTGSSAIGGPSGSYSAYGGGSSQPSSGWGSGWTGQASSQNQESLFHKTNIYSTYSLGLGDKVSGSFSLLDIGASLFSLAKSKNITTKFIKATSIGIAADVVGTIASFTPVSDDVAKYKNALGVTTGVIGLASSFYGGSPLGVVSSSIGILSSIPVYGTNESCFDWWANKFN